MSTGARGALRWLALIIVALLAAAALAWLALQLWYVFLNLYGAP